MAARPISREGAAAASAPVRVRWSLRARRDIEEIYSYVSADKPEAARRLAEKLMLAGDQLADHPYLGRVARPGELRELLVGSYLLIYRVVDDVVDIIAVVHGARRRKRG